MHASGAARIMVPRDWRLIFFERLRRLCCLNTALARTLPDAVRRKRFLALDFVFILGILFSLETGVDLLEMTGWACPLGRAGRRRAGLYRLAR